jgi:hypothetical protein
MEFSKEYNLATKELDKLSESLAVVAKNMANCVRLSQRVKDDKEHGALLVKLQNILNEHNKEKQNIT